jgi:hypothetical protein
MCRMCHQNKEDAQFYRQYNCLASRCKECIYQIRSSEEYKEKRRIQEQIYRNKNRDSYRKSKKKSRRNHPETQLLKQMRNRAKELNLEFNLEILDIIIPKKCPILGIELSLQDGFSKDNSPSVDRINNKKGYIKGNIIIISQRANSIKGDATLHELFLLADRYGKLIHGPDYKIPE